LKQLAHRLAVVEWFPYKSAKFKLACRVQSQEYGFALVRAALARGALLVIARGMKLWEESVPAIRTYPRKLTLSSVQNVALTPNNLKLQGRKSKRAWALLVGALT
jgi:hypothetical protein